MMPKGQITGFSFCYAPFGPVLLDSHTRFAILPAAKGKEGPAGEGWAAQSFPSQQGHWGAAEPTSIMSAQF